MCKLHGGRDVESGGMGLTKGREILPANIIPRHYDLTLEPDFKKLTYEGCVTIDLDVVEDTKDISLNTLELTIHSTKIIAGPNTIR
jgi:aminopeptidase 2